MRRLFKERPVLAAVGGEEGVGLRGGLEVD